METLSSFLYYHYGSGILCSLPIRKGKENLAEQSEGTACGEDEFAHLYV